MLLLLTVCRVVFFFSLILLLNLLRYKWRDSRHSRSMGKGFQSKVVGWQCRLTCVLPETMKKIMKLTRKWSLHRRESKRDEPTKFLGTESRILWIIEMECRLQHGMAEGGHREALFFFFCNESGNLDTFNLYFVFFFFKSVANSFWINKSANVILFWLHLGFY